MTIGISGVALAGLLVGLSSTYVMMLVFLVLMGILGGGYHPASPPLISTLVEPKNRGRALGFHLIGGSAAYFLAPLISAAIAAAWGWRDAFIGLAIPTILFGIVFYIFVGQRVDIKKTEYKITSIDKIPPVPGRLRRLVALITLNTLMGGVLVSTIAFIPLFMVDHFGVGKATAAAFVALIYSSGLWAAPLGGYLSDRLGKIPVMLVVCLMTGPVIYLLNLVSYGLGSSAVLVALGIVWYVRQPVVEAYVIDQASERRRSTMLGVMYFCSIESGGVLTPVMGYLIDNFGFYSSFTMAGVTLVIVTLVCSVFLWGKRD